MLTASRVAAMTPLLASSFGDRESGVVTLREKLLWRWHFQASRVQKEKKKDYEMTGDRLSLQETTRYTVHVWLSSENINSGRLMDQSGSLDRRCK